MYTTPPQEHRFRNYAQSVSLWVLVGCTVLFALICALPGVIGLSGLGPETSNAAVWIVMAVTLIGLAVLFARLARRETVVDHEGLTVIKVGSPLSLEWDEITGLKVDQSARHWLILAEVDGDDVVVYRHFLRELGESGAVHGAVRAGDGYGPPDWAPSMVCRAFATMDQYWRAQGGRDSAATPPAPPTASPEPALPVKVSEAPPRERRHLRDPIRIRRELVGASVVLSLCGGLNVVRAIGEGMSPLAGLIFPAILLVVFAVMFLIMSRAGTYISPEGLTVAAMFNRDHMPWHRIRGLEVEDSWGQWIVRAYCDNGPMVAYHLHSRKFRGRSRQGAAGSRQWPTPPDEAPERIRTAFTLINDYWHHHRMVRDL